MKKKLLSLALCLILCLPFLLTSCFGFGDDAGNDAPPPPPALPELSTYELLGGKFEPAEYYTQHTTTKIEGEVEAQSGALLYTAQSKLSTDSNELTTTHRVYNMEKGIVVYSASTTYSYYSFEYTSEYTTVEILLYRDYFVAEKSNDEEAITEIYSTNGSVLFTSEEKDVYFSSISLDFINEPAIIFDDGLYKIESTNNGDKATLIKDLEFATFVDFDEVSILPLPDGNYLATSEDYYTGELGRIAYILDKDFNFVRAIELFNNEYSIYDTETEPNLFLLNNGNIAVQIITMIGDYLDIVSSGVEYDFVVNERCFIVDTYIVETSTGTKTAVDTPYFFEYLISKYQIEMYDDAPDLSFEFENVAFVATIENKKLVPVTNSSYPITIVNNDLTIKGTYETLPLGYESGEIISDGKYILYTEFSAEIYNADGTLVKNIGDADINEKFVISSKAVYDHDMNLVYSLEDSELKISRVEDASIIFYKQDKETGNILYYRLNETSNEPQLFLTDDENTQVTWRSDYYYTTVYTPAEVEGEEGTILLTVYSAAGTFITNMSVSENADIESYSNDYDYITVVDGDEVSVIVLK